MASRYWVGGTASWDGTAGTKWALTSGGAGGQAVPTSSDDVFFDAASGAAGVTVAATSVCNNLVFTGFTGTFAGSSGLTISGNLTAVSGMSWTNSSPLTFNATSTGKTITSAGKISNNLTFAGTGGGWTLQDNLSMATNRTVTLTAGALDINGKTVTSASLTASGSTTRSITMGAGLWQITGGVSFTATGFTLTANTGVFDIVGGTGAIDFGGSTIYELKLTAGNRLYTVSSFSCTNLNSVSSTSRRRLTSGTLGTTKTITVSGTATLLDIDFVDITIAGAAAPASGTNLGDAGGNSGITFAGALTRYWVGNGGNWNSTTKWSTTSGGSSGASVPVAHDTAVFDASSITSGSQTISNVIQTLPNMDVSALANTPAFDTLGSSTFPMQMMGALDLSKLGTVTGFGAGVTIMGPRSGTFNLNMNNLSLAGITFFNPGATVNLTGQINSTANITFSGGTLNFGSSSHTSTTFSSSSGTRVLDLQSCTLTLNGTSSVWAITTSGLTFSAGTSEIVVNNATATAKSFTGAGLTYNKLTFSGAGSGALTISGNNTFDILKVDSSSLAKTLTLTASSVQTITTNLDAVGTSGKVITINSTTATNASFSKSTGSVICDYLALSDNTATGGAYWESGVNSTKSDAPGWDVVASGYVPRSGYVSFHDPGIF